MNERIVYLNGQLLPMREAKISIFDRGFSRGEGVYDVTRTFGGKPFRLREHLNRLYRSLHYARIDPGMSLSEMEKTTLNVVEVNANFLKEDGDQRIEHIVTSGVQSPVEKTRTQQSIVIYCAPIPFDRYAKFYKTGIRLITPSFKHIPQQCVDPRLKTTSRILNRLAQTEVQHMDRDADPLLLDLDGNITEITTANFFLAKKGAIYTPRSCSILEGISRQTVIELARELALPVFEDDIRLYDVFIADEAFQTATSYCILPVSYVNGVGVGGEIPGAITQRLLRAWSGKVGFDIVEQAEEHAKSSCQ